MNDSEEQSTSPGKLGPRDWRDTMVCTCRQFGTSWAGRAAGVHGLLCWVADQCHWVGDMVIRIQNRPGFECVNMCKLTEFGGSPADVKILGGGFQWWGYGWRSLGAQLEEFAILGPWTSPKFMTGIHNWMVAPSRGNFNLWVIFWAVFGHPKKSGSRSPTNFCHHFVMSPRWCIWVGCSRLVSTLWWTYYSKSCGCSISHGQIRVGWGDSVNPWFMNHVPFYRSF